MPFLPVPPADEALVATSVDLPNAATKVDDPGKPLRQVALETRALRYGWDLEPAERLLYLPDGAEEPVGVLDLHQPERDNTHLLWIEGTVHPDHRGRGHGSMMLAEALRLARERRRLTVVCGVWSDDPAAKAFVERHGFGYASHEARRLQVLATVDEVHLAELEARARSAAADYELVRTMACDDDLLAELVEVTAAINDAPRGELQLEDEVFDVARLRDLHTAAAGKGEKLYRVYARHRETGAIGGHTMVMVQPAIPHWSWQYDTAVHRDHRGHRLGLLLKIEMMRWLAVAEPSIETIETRNHADNGYMISVNESIGYRLDRVVDEYQLVLTP